MNLPTLSSYLSHGARVRKACEKIEGFSQLRPKVAIILGSGLGGLAADAQDATTISFSDIPGFLPPRAAGHAGNLILGSMGSFPVALLQGRVHRYEGYPTESVVFPVQCMSALGAEILIVTNAAGGLNPRFQRGDIMVIEDHIHWLWNGWRKASDKNELIAPSPMDPSGQVLRSCTTYSPELIQLAMRISLKNQRAVQRGTYISTLGPTYETRAEYRMFRWMGADAVGMSTTAEVLAASHVGMKVLALSVITNVASMNVPQSTCHDEVVDAGEQAEPHLRCLIRGMLSEIAGGADVLL